MARSELPQRLREGPFLLGDARRLGFTDEVVQGPRFRRVFRGVYVAADAADTVAVRAAAARLLVPASAIFSHQTAAELLDLPVPTDGLVHCTLPRGVRRAQVAGIVAHQVTSMPAAMLTPQPAGTLPITSPSRTFMDVAASLPLVELVILGDAMVRRGLVDLKTLRHEVRAATMVRGIVTARRAAGLVQSRVDSPMETRLRLLIVLAGLPPPEPGGEVLDVDGQWIATVDLLYRAQRVVIEYDGLLHLTSRRKWLRDLATRDLLRDLGWEVIVVTSADVFATPLRTLLRIRDKLAARGHPDLPEHLDPAWELLLPRGARRAA
jgi:hypothetical protein